MIENVELARRQIGRVRKRGERREFTIFGHRLQTQYDAWIVQVFSVDAFSQRPEPMIVVVTLSLVVEPA